MRVAARRRGLLARIMPRLAPLSAIVVASAFAQRVTSDPGRLDPRHAWSGPSWAEPLGYGEGGMDLLPVVASAELRAIALAASVSLLGLVLGAPLGAAAALSRGGRERAFERASDLVQAFPSFIFAIAVLSAVPHPSRLHIAGVFVLTAWAPFGRLALAQTRVLRDAAFVEAARALGRGRLGVLAHHVVPQLLDIAAVQLGSSAGAVVVSEAALAFVGFGPADGVSLGAIVGQGVSIMLRAPHVLVVGATAVFATSTAMLVAGGSLQASRPRAAPR